MNIFSLVEVEGIFGSNQSEIQKDCVPSHEFCSEFIQFKILGISPFQIASIIPISILLFYLILKLKSSIKFLKRRNGLIIRTFYTYSWALCVFNLFSIFIGIFFDFNLFEFPNEKIYFRTPYLISESFIIYIQFSVLSFLLSGKSSQSTIVFRTTIFTLILTNFYIIIKVSKMRKGLKKHFILERGLV